MELEPGFPPCGFLPPVLLSESKDLLVFDEGGRKSVSVSYFLLCQVCFWHLAPVPCGYLLPCL